MRVVTDAPGRLIGAGSAVAAACGMVVGPLGIADFPVDARLLFGGVGGLLVGAGIGALATVTGLLTACALAVVGVAGGGQRAGFVLMGSAVALSAAWHARPLIMTPPQQLWVMLSLAIVTVGAGSLLARRYVGKACLSR
ncbi:hypothetical protein ACWKWC_03320 [Geodermatophilus nigrescens]